jgi:hypothetical protein
MAEDHAPDQPADQADDVDTTDPGVGTCESCGREDEELYRVRRVYVTPEAWDQEEKVEVVPEPEVWCYVCLTHYPHQQLAPPPRGGDEG